MPKIVLKANQGFIFVQGFFIMLFIYVILVLVVLGFMAFFNISMITQWRNIMDLEEASIKVGTIASNLDTCIAMAKDCQKCALMMVDPANPPFLENFYESSNFKYDIEGYVPGGTSCVIHAVRVDGQRFPIYSSRPYNPVSYNCGGLHIKVNDRISGVDLCREKSGERTVHKFGKLQDLAQSN